MSTQPHQSLAAVGHFCRERADPRQPPPRYQTRRTGPAAAAGARQRGVGDRRDHAWRGAGARRVADCGLVSKRRIKGLGPPLRGRGTAGGGSSLTARSSPSSDLSLAGCATVRIIGWTTPAPSLSSSSTSVIARNALPWTRCGRRRSALPRGCATGSIRRLARRKPTTRGDTAGGSVTPHHPPPLTRVNP